MTDADRAAFVEAIVALAVARNEVCPEARLHVWFAALRDLELAEVRRACLLALQSLKFFPTVAEIRELARPYASHEAAAAEAFRRIVALGEYTPAGTRWNIRAVAEFIGPAAAEAFAACGYRAFEGEGLSESNLPYTRLRFTEAYVLAARAQAMGREILLPESARRLPAGSPVKELVRQTALALSLDTKQRQLPRGEE